MAIAVPDRDIAVSVIEFIENFLHILLLQPAGQFLVIGDAGVLEGLLERNILIPVLVFISGPVISEFAVQIPDNYFSFQLGSNNLIGGCALHTGNSFVSQL